MIKKMVCSKRNLRKLIIDQKFPDDVAVINGADLVATNGTTSRKDIYLSTFQYNAIEIERCDPQVLYKISFSILQPEDRNETCQIFFDDSWAWIFSGSFINDQYIFRSKLIDIVASNKRLQVVYIGLWNFQGLADVENKIGLSL